MSTTLLPGGQPTAPGYEPPAPYRGHAASPGRRTRVRLIGTGPAPEVRSALTRAWRLAGQPIVVLVPPLWGDTERAAVDWAAEHAVAGIGIEIRHDVDAVPPPVVEVPADGPVPWCGCPHPPCARCLAADVRDVEVADRG